MNILLFALFALMFATAVALVVGLVFMARGGAVSEKYSNKLMVARVALQGGAILLLGLIFYLCK